MLETAASVKQRQMYIQRKEERKKDRKEEGKKDTNKQQLITRESLLIQVM